jgi:hypothetical protein
MVFTSGAAVGSVVGFARRRLRDVRSFMRAFVPESMRVAPALLCVAVLCACGSETVPPDAGPLPDASRDAGVPEDAGEAQDDASAPRDGGPAADGGSVYAMAEDPLPLAGCTIFPRDTVFHADIRTLPVHPRSAEWIAYLGATSALRVPSLPIPMAPLPPGRYGVPINVADAGTARVRVEYNGVYAIERQYDGPFPKPSPFAIQDGFDQHSVVLETSECASYELIGTTDFFGVLRALGGARVDLSSHDYLPMAHAVTAPGIANLPTLLRADEVRAGHIDHVMLFSMPRVKSTDPLWPAKRTDGIATETAAIPMGAWLRLRADFDVTALPPAAQIVARALQRHGLLLGDSGGVADALVMRIEKTSGFVDASGRSVEDELHAIQRFVTAGDFEVIDALPMQVDPDSLRIR